jgi:alpha-D-ribose 1-methylphosphonate 5-triphosphate synthase subunit PhnG
MRLVMNVIESSTMEHDSRHARAYLMRICTQATINELERAIAAVGLPEVVEDIRPPERGLVMIRGRAGGDGQSFNVGEASVTRAAVRLPGGIGGFAYIMGRDLKKARIAAIIDALGQSTDMRNKLETVLVAPVVERVDREKDIRRRQTAATRVEFFTLVRGED